MEGSKFVGPLSHPSLLLVVNEEECCESTADASEYSEVLVIGGVHKEV